MFGLILRISVVYFSCNLSYVPPCYCITRTNFSLGCYNPGAMQIVNDTCQYYIGKYMGLIKILFNG